MSTKLFEVSSFHVERNGDAMGQYIGINFGPGLVLTDEGKLLRVDTAATSGAALSGTPVDDDYNALPGELLLVDSYGASVIINLPDDAADDTTIIVKSAVAESEAIIVQAADGQSIDGSPSITINALECLTFMFHGTTWYVTAKYLPVAD